MASTLRDLSISILITIVILLIYMIYTAHYMDKQNVERSDAIMLALRKHPMQTGYDVAKIARHAIIAHKLKKSRRNRIIKSCKDGAIRGALGGAIMGGGIPVVIGGAVIWSTVTGFLSGIPMIENKIQHIQEKFS